MALQGLSPVQDSFLCGRIVRKLSIGVCMLSRVRDHAQVYGTAKRRDRDVSVPPRPQRVLDASFSCWRGELPDSFHQRQHHLGE